MAIKNSTQLGVGMPDDRISGFTKSTNGPTAFYGANPLVQDTTDTSGKSLILSNGLVDSTHPLPLGLVSENTNGYQTVAAQGDTAAGGSRFDTIQYARGGNYSLYHRPGNFVDIFDDNSNTTPITPVANTGTGGVAASTPGPQNTSCPFLASDTFAAGQRVFILTNATGQGLLTNTPPANFPSATRNIVQVGWVRAVTGSGATQKITVELMFSAV